MGKDKTFFEDINLMCRPAMINFLENHFRYNTMSSWNNSTSYANSMKIHKFNFPDNAYEVLQQGQVFDGINELIRDWDEEQDQYYQAGFNGRAGGYLVMYQGGKDPQIKKRFTRPGKGVDQGEDFTAWSDEELKDRCQLVQSFDKLCDAIVAAFRYVCEHYAVEDVEIMVPKTVQVLEEKTA